MQTPWSDKLRSFVVLNTINDLQELADKFRLKAAQLRQDARSRRFIWPWTRDRILIEATVWEDAAKVIENTVILER